MWFSQKTVLKKLLSQILLTMMKFFLICLENRNLSSHVYDRKTSEEIFQTIKSVYINILENLKLEETL